ncbi:PrsW family intramembrane metalloprotease [Plantactinospora sp. S1510]|uniref:PrsW family intramembrane metalloprotease n=1 Tax=Plantactinospora alkalitolerans TaxID=2789879 RepID=A0ABS0GSC6_9ACTN|nr:PrsW family intramembrane metalloprotease [Plantactinospora alkalitolerans]MBF9129097.1 PrsW family intramembrane metalloprotease [Plantactinospora alkalitolerans]
MWSGQPVRGDYADHMADTPPGTAAPQSPAPTPPWSPPTLSPAPQPPPGLPAVKIAGQRQGLSAQRLAVMIGAILLIAVCAVLMLVELGEPAGVTPLVIGLVAAVLPVPVLVACFLWLDRYEPEPIKYLLFCFGWGAAVSTYSALQVNTFAGDVGLPVPLVGVLVAPFIEELTKALGPVLLLLYRRRQWSGITDGIVYCGLSAVGFAMVENILYLGLHGYADGADQYGPATGAQNVFGIFIMRVLITGFAHPLFTSMTGVGLGIAARTADIRIRILTPIAGLLLAMILHGTWNLTATLVQETGETLILLYGYISLMVPIFLGMVGLAIWLRSWEGRITERRLPGYVRAGWLTPPELAALTNIGRRHAARRWARRVAGDEGFKAMRRFQFAATRLALLRDGLTRGLDAKPVQRARALAEERELLGAMNDARQAFVGRDPQAPAGVWDGSYYHLTFPDGSLRTLEAPHEPVVPIPVVLAPPRPQVPAGVGYGPPGSYCAAPTFGAPPGASWPGPQQHR